MRHLIGVALLLFVLPASVVRAGTPVGDPHLHVDQFGWRPIDTKVAVLSDPRVGFNAPSPYTPGADLQVRRVADDAVVFTGPVTQWRGGAVHGESGDAAWHFDFSAVTEPDEYYLHDVTNDVSSHVFRIAEDVYSPVLRAALRSLLYQRCGVEKHADHAGASWTDTACHLGPEQDLDCRPVFDPGGAGLDLSGGWHDAGDYNKYVNFTDGAIHDLLAAWRENPDAFTDAADLPESGNGIPDVLDEARVELDWFLKMQRPDGSVIHKVSVTDWAIASPPSADTAPRRYSETTGSATVSACGAFAHAATVFRMQGSPEALTYADDMERAALSAWGWLEANPGSFPSYYGNGGYSSASAEDSDYHQRASRTCAAIYLYELTGETRFRDHVDATFRELHMMQWNFVYPFEPEFQDAALLYASLPGATPATATALRDTYAGSLYGGANLQHHADGDDPYRAWLQADNYTWASNRTQAHSGLMYYLAVRYGLDPARDAEALDAARGYTHYLHGINPVGLVYLTNMGGHGAETSTTTLYHGWFADGTDWDQVGTSLHGPPPGILPGGPNRYFAPDPSYGGPPLEPPQNQPVMKSYRDWNTSWPENSWEVTENQIAYQAAYIRLLAWSARPATVASPTIDRQPVEAVGCDGGSAMLSVEASGDGMLGFAWRRDGLELAEGAPYLGVATASLTVDPVGPGTVGTYDVVITDGGGTSVTSDGAELRLVGLPGAVGPSLRLRLSGGGHELSWAAATDATEYLVQACVADAGACTPMTLATVDTTTHEEADDGSSLVWYLVSASNPCGENDG
ncbi:MAG: glycoside hydrolase family 9 protein [Acidobacteriota bacterium]